VSFPSDKWHRRLLWAWLIITAVWLALAWWAIAPVAEWRLANRDLMFTFNGRTVLVPPSVDAGTLVTTLTQAFPKETAEKMAASFDPYARWEKLAAVVLQVISVPSILLGVGLAGLRVVKDFSKSERKKG
jgi:hypothetical protein